MPKASFDSESGKAAGIKSGIARSEAIPDNIIDKVLTDTRYTHALVTSWLKANPCDTCKRSGPKSLSELVKLAELQAKLGEQLLDRYRGKPSTESNLERNASVSDYIKALRTLTCQGDSEEEKDESQPQKDHPNSSTVTVANATVADSDEEKDKP